MPDSELFNGVESTNNSQAVLWDFSRTPCCRHDARSTLHLTTDNSQHRRNGRESIFIASPSRVPCSCKAKANASICRQRSGSAPKRGRESANRRLQFQKSRELFLRVHNETLSVVAMCVRNEDCWRVFFVLMYLSPL